MVTGFGPSLAWASLCAPGPFPTVYVKLLDPKEHISSSKSLKQINSSAKGHGLVGKGEVALGTTESRVSTDMSIQFTWSQRRPGTGSRVCVRIKSVDLTFGHSKLLVNLPREYKRGSCEYKVVLRHEMAHVQVNRTGVRKYARVLKSAISQELQRSRTIEASSMSRGTKTFQNRLKAVIAKTTKRFNKDIKVLHGKIDGPGSPYGAKGMCRSW